jgi:hypothetical protein
MSARFYSPGIGAFTQMDSVLGGPQNPLSMNRFLYALANPATMVDPTGHLGCPGNRPAFDGQQCQGQSTNGLNNDDGGPAPIWSKDDGGDSLNGDDPPTDFHTPDHESDPPTGPKRPPYELDILNVDFETPGAPSEADMRSQFTLCTIYADGDPSRNLMCMQGNLGDEYGLYAFVWLAPNEYDARDTDWLIGPASVAVMVAGIAFGRLPTAEPTDVLVLGKYPGYLDFLESVKLEGINTRVFSIPKDVYEALPDKWVTTQAVLDQAVLDRVPVVFSNPATPEFLTGTFAREVAYLLSKGYKLTDDLMGMKP